jgi:ribosomal protein S20
MRLVVVVALALLALAGCSAAPTDLESTAATDLQTAVVAVATPAAAADYETAITQLDEVQARLDAAIEDGAVSASRAAQIQSAIDVVRADLEAALAEEQETATPEEPAEPTKPGKGNKPEKPGKDK